MRQRTDDLLIAKKPHANHINAGLHGKKSTKPDIFDDGA